MECQVRLVVQRVSSASVQVDHDTVASIDSGLLVLVAVEHDDADVDSVAAARKVTTLRMFADADGRMNRSVADVGGSILAVSQFTLAADVRRGRRPSFVGAADPEEAVPLFDRFVDECRAAGIRTETGRFGARMEVSLVNDGPVTFVAAEVGAGWADRLTQPLPAR